MERKRKLPARAAARVEQAAKKGRTSTPPDHRPATPSSAVNSTPAPDDEDAPKNPPPPPLPTSIQPGKPLPTIENAQPEDLPSKDFQSLQERYRCLDLASSVLASTSIPVCTVCTDYRVLMLQWCPSRIPYSLAQQMDQRWSFREILDKACQKEGRHPGRPQKPAQG